MTTKIIKALVDGVIQNIEVEDLTSPEQMLSPEERLDALEDKPIITDGNFLIGNGTDEMEEITPEEVLSHINGANVTTMTTAEFEAMSDDDVNANTLYMLTDSEEGAFVPTVTTDDNGKFLRVVDGAWTAATIPNAEDGEF